MSSNQTPEQKQKSDRARIQWGSIISGAWQTCLNCGNWESEQKNFAGYCRRFAQVPPLDVIVAGCQDHEPYTPF